MRLERQKPIPVIWCLFIFLSASLLACESRFYTYRGAVADQEERVVIAAGGPHPGIWRTIDLTLSFQYTKEADRLDLAGEIELDESFRYNFITLEHFSMRVNFLDLDGRVLESVSVFNSGYRQRLETFYFNRRLDLPDGATAMTFSYNGRVRESGQNSSFWDFWKTPYP
jgi:hypothetical protein